MKLQPHGMLVRFCFLWAMTGTPVFSILSNPKYFLSSWDIFSLMHMLCRGIMFSSYWNIFVFSRCLYFNFLWSQKLFCIIRFFFFFFLICKVFYMPSYFGDYIICTWKECAFCCWVEFSIKAFRSAW